MTDQEKPTATSANVAETPHANSEEHRFGDTAKQDSKQQIAEDEAAEQLGNFA